MSRSRQTPQPPEGSQKIMLPRRRMNSGKGKDSEHQMTQQRPHSEPVRYRSCTRVVTNRDLDLIVDRVTRPTVASRGGVDLLNKDFTYIIPRPRKTLIVVPGLERRYLGLKKVNKQEMQLIVARLTRMTTAYSAKFGANDNVWVDDSPKRERFRPHSVL